jgi:hypothetical protein
MHGIRLWRLRGLLILTPRIAICASYMVGGGELGYWRRDHGVCGGGVDTRDKRGVDTPVGTQGREHHMYVVRILLHLREEVIQEADIVMFRLGLVVLHEHFIRTTIGTIFVHTLYFPHARRSVAVMCRVS